MKPDFASKQKKAAKKKKSKAIKKIKATGVDNKDGDVAMQDSAMAEIVPSTAEGTDIAVRDADETPQLGARDKHRNAVALRHSLKARVQVLKKARQKVAKGPNHKGARREITNEIKGLKEERSGLPKT